MVSVSTHFLWYSNSLIIVRRGLGVSALDSWSQQAVDQCQASFWWLVFNPNSVHLKKKVREEHFNMPGVSATATAWIPTPGTAVTISGRTTAETL